MRKKLLISLSLAVVLALCVGIAPVLSQGQVAYAAYNTSASTYYNGITATSGQALLGQLHDLITTTHSYYTSYDECRAVNYVNTDPGSNSNYLMEFYTQADISANSFDVSGGWNREHVWPKADSNGIWKDVSNSTRGGGADLHHIRPAEKDLNNVRGNLKFGNVTNGTARKASGTDIVGGYSNSNTFMPLDEVKGDVARILFYVYTHYNTYSNVNGTTNGSGSYFGTLNFTHIVTAANEEAAIQILLEWNKNDPVDDIERTRNEEVAKVQGNRNPFIDNENYADAIWGNGNVGGGDSDELISISITPATTSVAVGATTTLQLVKNPTNATASVTWSSSDNNVATVSQSGVVTGKAAGTATITATPSQSGVQPATATVTVTGSSGTTPSQSGEFTITLDNFTGTGYGYHPWVSGDVQGTAFIYTGTAGKMQFTTKQAHYYLASTTPTPGGLTEITIVTDDSKQWELLTSNNAYGEEATNAVPKDGTSQGTSSGKSYTWTLDGTDKYFSLNYKGTNAGYLLSITVKYASTATPDPTQKSLTLDKNILQMLVGGTETLTATLNGGLTGTPTWTSGNSNVATVTNGVVKAVGEGTATITAELDGYTATCQVKVENELTMSTDPIRLSVGETYTAEAVATSTITWASSNTGVATVDDDGVVTAVSQGRATITAICGSKQLSFSVIVADSDTPPDELQEVEITFDSGFEVKKSGYNLLDWTQDSLAGKAYVYTTDSQLQFKKAAGFLLNTVATTGGIVSVKLELKSGTIADWQLLTSNTAFAAVKEQLPTGGTEQTNVVIDGNTAIWTLDGRDTFFTLNNAGSVSIVAKITVTFNKTEIVPTDSVTLDKTEMTLNGVGVTGKINTVDPTSGTPVWTTSDPSVATVEQDGTVTAVGRGAATITATCGTATATCEVTVNVPYIVSLNKDTLTLQVGDSETLIATATGDVTFSTIHTDIISVDPQTGKITALSVGTAIVIAMCGDATASCTVTVIERAQEDSVTLDKTTAGIKVGETVTITANATGDVVWTTSNASIATVVNGVVTGISAGTVTITATCGTATATCQVTVTASQTQDPIDSVTLNKTEVELTVGQSESLMANATGPVTWSSSDESVVTVNERGSLMAISAGKATITATCGTATATCTVTVIGQSVEEEDIAAFLEAVAAIGSDATEQTFNAIKRALELYAELNDKESVSESYAELLAKIDAYNAAKADINNAMSTALHSLFAPALAIAEALAVVFILKRFK